LEIGQRKKKRNTLIERFRAVGQNVFFCRGGEGERGLGGKEMDKPSED